MTIFNSGSAVNCDGSKQVYYPPHKHTIEKEFGQHIINISIKSGGNDNRCCSRLRNIYTKTSPAAEKKESSEK